MSESAPLSSPTGTNPDPKNPPAPPAPPPPAVPVAPLPPAPTPPPKVPTSVNYWFVAVLVMIALGLVLYVINYYSGSGIPACLEVVYGVILAAVILGWLAAVNQPVVQNAKAKRSTWVALYLIGAILLALYEIRGSWPVPTSSPVAASLWNQKPADQLDDLKRITLASLTTLHSAQDAITRWLSAGGVSQVTQADKASIQAGLDYTAQMSGGIVYTISVANARLTNTTTKLITNQFSVANLWSNSQMTATVGLTQVAEIKSETNYWTNKETQLMNQNPGLLLSGDLRQVSAKQLQNASIQLGIAIQQVQARYNFLVINRWLDSDNVVKKLYSQTNMALLTPSEYDSFQKSSNQRGEFSAETLQSDSPFALVILLMACGALGGAIRSLASLAKYLGTQRFKDTWAAHYLFCPIIGAVLALVFFLVLKGGIGTNAISISAPSNVFGYCAIALLVGMFSNEAMAKLGKIADALFTNNTSTDDADDPNELNIQSVRIAGQPDLTTANITNWPDLAAQFKTALAAGGSPVTLDQIKAVADLSKFLVQHFSAVTQSQLTAWTAGTDVQLSKAVVADLNMVIKTQLLYQAPLFAAVTSPSVAKLQKLVYGTVSMPTTDPVQSAIHQLNRWLVAWAYASDMACWQITLQGQGFLTTTTISMDGKTLPNDVTPVFANGQLQFGLKFTDHEPGTLALSVQNPNSNTAQSSEFDVSLT